MKMLQAVASVRCQEYIKYKRFTHVLAFHSSNSFLLCFLSHRSNLPFENFIYYLHYGVDMESVVRALPKI